MNGFLDLADLGRDAVVDLLALAARLEEKPEPNALAGRTLGLVFFNPSLRTLASMQAAMAQLGGNSFVITPGSGSWDLETGDGVVMNERTDVLRGLGKETSLPVMGVFEVVDGKIAAWRDYFDMGAITAAFAG